MDEHFSSVAFYVQKVRDREAHLLGLRIICVIRTSHSVSNAPQLALARVVGKALVAYYVQKVDVVTILQFVREYKVAVTSSV